MLMPLGHIAALSVAVAGATPAFLSREVSVAAVW